MKTLVSLKNVLLLLFVATIFIACDNDDDPIAEPELQTIADIASSNSDFSTLVSALQRTDLVGVLDGAGAYTVFAPTNDAFTALGVDLNTISNDDLASILLYHVLGAEVKAGDISEGQSYASTASTNGPDNNALSILIEKSGGSVKINGISSVTTADIQASNGVIHVVDAVITPLDVVGHALANENFTQLVSALGIASGDLVSVLQGSGPFTVFAPVNSAFEEISSVVATLTAEDLSSVLTYHVVGSANVKSSDLSNGMEVSTVNGGIFTVNLSTPPTIVDANGGTATIILTDEQATNGVIHVLDKVILP